MGDSTEFRINGKSGWATIISFIILLLAVLLAIPTAHPVTAQEAGQSPTVKVIVYETDDGDSQIISQQMLFEASHFEQFGSVEEAVVTPAGITLPQGVQSGTYLSDPLSSPLEFTTDIGLEWQAHIPDAAAASMEIRLSDDGQSWSEWQPAADEDALVTASRQIGSLVWVNQANIYLQFRVTLQTGGQNSPLLESMTLYFNDTSQGPSNLASLAQNETDIPVNTCPAKPAVIPRTEWGCPGQENSPYWPPAYHPVTHIVINQTFTPNSADDWASVVRSIWHYHAKILGWGDIGYNYLIDPLGNIYEGRAGGDDAIGAFDGFNRGAMGIGYIGCFGRKCKRAWLTSADPTPEMLDAGNALTAWKSGQKQLDPLGNGEYCEANLSTITGRSEVTCRGYIPTGKRLADHIPDVRLDVQSRLESCEIPPSNAPMITSVIPASEYNSTDVLITVEGQNFEPNSDGFSVTLVNNLDTYPLSLGDLRTGTVFQAIVPEGQPVGQYDVVVTNPDGQMATAPKAYESMEEGTGTDATVRFSPDSLSVSLHESKDMTVQADSISNLYGVDLKLSYDSDLVEVVDADPDTAGTQVSLGDTFKDAGAFVVKNEAVDGLIQFSAARRAPAPAFDGTGSIIEIDWRGISVGETELHLDQVKLSDPDGQPLQANLEPDGLISVGDGINVVIKGVVKLQSNNNSARAKISWDDEEMHPKSDGTFEIPIALADSYKLHVKAPGFLSAIASEPIPDGVTEIDLGTITLPGGEVTGDEYIDIFDLAFMANRYDTDDPLADVNGDGTADIFDLTLAASNYDRSGPITIGLDAKLRDTLSQSGISPLDFGPTPDPAKVALGQMLYFDKELGGNRDVACSTCHLASQHTSDGLSLSIGVGGSGLGSNRQLGTAHGFIPRNATDVFNRGAPEWNTMFWDSRITGIPDSGFLPDGLENVLAVQAMFPVVDREEMRGQAGDTDINGQPNELALVNGGIREVWVRLMTRLLAIPSYVDLFSEAYPGVPTEQLGFQHAANAIAAFEIDAFTFTNSPWDRYVAGDDTAMPEAAKEGALVFYGKRKCGQCHSGNLLTDQQHHNIAAPQIGPGKGEEAPLDFGRGQITEDPADKFAFRTPPLRNVTLTGPWTHAGAYTSLEAAVRHHLNPEQSLRNYSPGQLRAELQNTFQGDETSLSDILSNLDPIVTIPTELSDTEVSQVMAFLNALTDPASVNMLNTAPASVPSGLPIDK